MQKMYDKDGYEIEKPENEAQEDFFFDEEDDEEEQKSEEQIITENVDGTYDASSVYEQKISEHVKSILLLCDQYHIPVFMTFAVENTKKDTKYESEILSPDVEGRDLKKDLIHKHALVMSGFDVVPEAKQTILEDLF